MSTKNIQVSLDGIHFFSTKSLRVKVIDDDEATEVQLHVTKRGVETHVMANGRLVGTDGATFDNIIKNLQ